MRSPNLFTGLAAAVVGLFGLSTTQLATTPVSSASAAGADSAITRQVVQQDDADLPDGFEFDGQLLSTWNPSDMRAIDMQADNRIPLILPPSEVLDDTVFMWDAWPLRTWDGEIAEIDGWKVLVGLSAERTPDEGPVFYTVSQWRYWFTKDGDWKPGGLVFTRDEALGSRQWAGSAKYDPDTNTAAFYYTAVGGDPTEAAELLPSSFPQGDPAAGRPPVDQTIAVVEAQVETSDDGLTFTNFGEHREILQADGEIYQTIDDAVTDAVIYGFRDPWAFEDPDSGDRYLLFTGNAAFDPGPQNGVVGVAREDTDGSWVLESPIVAAPGVSSQLERPHMVWREDGVYLFWSTHSFTFSEPGSGPEGLYGMIAPSGDWKGQYVPLNRGGLVAGNPEAAPTQTYSYLVLPSGHVMSYLNTAGTPEGSPPAGSWVGAPSPMFRIEMDGATTAVAFDGAAPASSVRPMDPPAPDTSGEPDAGSDDGDEKTPGEEASG